MRGYSSYDKRGQKGWETQFYNYAKSLVVHGQVETHTSTYRQVVIGVALIKSIDSGERLVLLKPTVS